MYIYKKGTFVCNILDMTSLWSYKAKCGRRTTKSHQTKKEWTLLTKWHKAMPREV